MMSNFVQDLFVSVLNMSITASFVILLVVIVSPLFRRVTRTIVTVLWLAVFFRLVCPLSFSSRFSLAALLAPPSGTMDYIPRDIGMMPKPELQTGIPAVNDVLSSALPPAAETASVNPMQILLFAGAFIWIVGVITLIAYSLFRYVLLKRSVQTAMTVGEGVYECEHISSPFVLGIFKPHIYLPLGLTAAERHFVLEHEQAHIRRFDHLLKPAAFLIVCLHWFNPLAWLSYVLLARDIELSCDEAVLKSLGSEVKKDYSSALLSIAAGKGLIFGNPLAFSENNTKKRIQHILSYKRPALWVTIISTFLIACYMLYLISNPVTADQGPVPNASGGDGAIQSVQSGQSDRQSQSNRIGSPGTQAQTTAAELSPERAKEMKALVDENMALILSSVSPAVSSNPGDYIRSNSDAYENILKYGGRDAASYILSEFENGTVSNDLRGHILMILCKEILGAENNVTDETLLPLDWYQALDIQPETSLPDFSYGGSDPILALVYQTELEQAAKDRNGKPGFLIAASHLFAQYEEGDLLKVFVSTQITAYRLYGNMITEAGGSAYPAAITYRKQASGAYTLERYERAKDGGDYGPSIRAYCTMPVSGKNIKGIADKIISGSSSDELRQLKQKNLLRHLEDNHLKEIMWRTSDGRCVPLTERIEE